MDLKLETPAASRGNEPNLQQQMSVDWFQLPLGGAGRGCKKISKHIALNSLALIRIVIQEPRREKQNEK